MYHKFKLLPPKTNGWNQKISLWKGNSSEPNLHFGVPAVSFRGGYRCASGRIFVTLPRRSERRTRLPIGVFMEPAAQSGGSMFFGRTVLAFPLVWPCELQAIRMVFQKKRWFLYTLRLRSPSYGNTRPSKRDTPNRASKQVVLTPHEIPRSLRV